jgi:hypothetical protein
MESRDALSTLARETAIPRHACRIRCSAPCRRVQWILAAAHTDNHLPRFALEPTRAGRPFARCELTAAPEGLIGLSACRSGGESAWESRAGMFTISTLRMSPFGEYRVFYDIQEAEETVKVRAVRHKPPHKTTEEIL